MDETPVLIVEGAVSRPIRLTAEVLRGFPESSQVVDVTRFHPKRPGDGVTLEAILERVEPLPGARYLTLHADRDDFHVSVPLEPVRGEAIVVYRHGAEALTVAQGGPFRFLIRDPAACHTAELDDCANVKFLSRIELSIGRGRDTRPADEAAHEALHRDQTP